MAEDVRAETRVDADLDGSGLRIAVVASRFNDHVTLRLLDGVRRGFDAVGVTGHSEHWVPGAFELPFAAKTLAVSGGNDGIVCVGCVIRGDTTHYEEVAGQCAAGIQRAQLDTGVPIAFGVLTTENLDQALVRSEGPGGHNVGEEAAHVVVEMARLVATVQASTGRS